MRILYGVSPIGLGHASRAAAIGLRLREKGNEPEFATGGRAAAFLRSYGFTVHDVVRAPTPSESRGVMRRPWLWYLRYWLDYRSTRSRMQSLVARGQPELVVGDEEFSTLSVALDLGMKNAMISDELELNFARGSLSRMIERRVSRWYLDLQRRVQYILVPDFGRDRENIKFTSPVVRRVTKTREETLSSLGIDPDLKVVLFSASGSGVGSFFLEATIRAFEGAGIHDAVLAVTGLEPRRRPPGVLFLGLERDNQNLVAAADLVISTAGKSTIDEALGSGTPIVALPIKNHSEQEKNAEALGYSYGDVKVLGELISRNVGRRTAPRDYKGDENISSFLLQLFER